MGCKDKKMPKQSTDTIVVRMVQGREKEWDVNFLYLNSEPKT